MKIITVGNQKGGAGKTTTALNLILGLQKKHRRVKAVPKGLTISSTKFLCKSNILLNYFVNILKYPQRLYL